MTKFRTLKWCIKRDRDCEFYKMFIEGNEVQYLNYSTRKEFIYVKFKDGTFDNLPLTTSVQVD